MFLDRMPGPWMGELSAKELEWLEGQVKTLPAVIDAVEKRLLQGHSPVVLGHNDMQPGNILVKIDPGKDATKELRLIDFEYTDFVPRGYDIVNSFCEWAADYHGPTPHIMDYSFYPSPAQQHAFCRAYLEAKAAAEEGKDSSVTEEEVEGLVGEAQSLIDLSHLWWGMWSLLQVTQSTIAFDYLGYARCRLEQIPSP